LPLKIPLEHAKWAEELLTSNGITNRDILIGCQLSSHGECRRWKIGKWIELATNCPKWTFLFLSDEKKHSEIEVPRNVLNISNQTNLSEFIALISKCDLLICPDSSGMHIAPRLQVPCIVLSGSTKVEYHMKFYPKGWIHPIYAEPRLKCSPCFDWQVRHDCYQKENAPWCLSRISSQKVELLAKKIL